MAVTSGSTCRLPGQKTGAGWYRYDGSADRVSAQAACVAPCRCRGPRDRRRRTGFERRVDLVGKSAVLEGEVRLMPRGRENPIADEPVADAAGDADLAERAGDRHAGRDRVPCAFAALDHLDEAHHVRRREEVQPDDVGGAAAGLCNDIHVEVGGVGGEDGARFRHGAETREHRFLDLISSKTASTTRSQPASTAKSVVTVSRPSFCSFCARS